jgi:hypothetical protein
MMGKAPLARFTRACLRFGANFKDSFCFGRPDDKDQYRPAVMLVQLDMRLVDDFVAEAKPVDWQYKSPAWFDNGTLRACYEGPLDEVTKRHEESKVKPNVKPSE